MLAAMHIRQSGVGWLKSPAAGYCKIRIRSLISTSRNASVVSLPKGGMHGRASILAKSLDNDVRTRVVKAKGFVHQGLYVSSVCSMRDLVNTKECWDR